MLLKLSRDLYLHCQRFYCKVQTWALSRKEGEIAGGDRNNSATMVDGSVPEREKKQGHQEGSKSCDNNRDGKRSLTKSIQSWIKDGGRLFWKSGMEWRGEDWEDKDLNGGKEWRNTWGCWVWTKWMHRTENNGHCTKVVSPRRDYGREYNYFRKLNQFQFTLSLFGSLLISDKSTVECRYNLN